MRMIKEIDKNILTNFYNAENYINFSAHWALTMILLNKEKENPNWEFARRLEGLNKPIEK